MPWSGSDAMAKASCKNRYAVSHVAPSPPPAASSSTNNTEPGSSTGTAHITAASAAAPTVSPPIEIHISSLPAHERASGDSQAPRRARTERSTRRLLLLYFGSPATTRSVLAHSDPKPAVRPTAGEQDYSHITPNCPAGSAGLSRRRCSRRPNRPGNRRNHRTDPTSRAE